MITIVDGDNDWLQDVPEFVELYNNHEIRVSEIKEHFGYSNNNYTKIFKHCIANDLITRRHTTYRKPAPSRRRNPTYISKNRGNGHEYWVVIKRVDGERRCFGNFKDYRQAERMVELCKECDWDISKRDELKEQVLREWNCRK